MAQKLSQNQMSELKEKKKIKVVQLHEYTPKQLSNPTPTQKNSQLGLQKVKNYPKLNQDQMSELKKTKKMKVVQLHE